MKPPLVVFAFNRPNKLRETLGAIRRQTIQPPRIIAFVDGQRFEAEHDAVEDCVNQLHKMPNSTVYWREKNYGCAHNIMRGLDQVVSEYSEFLVLEDDVVPAEGWYEALSSMLKHYEHNPKVATVGSFPTVLRNKLADYPYDVFMTPRFSCWGWGSTSLKFKEIIECWKRYIVNDTGDLTHVTDSTGIDIVNMLKSDPDRRLWDAVVAAAMMSRGQVQAVTKTFMSTNIGADLHLE